MSELPGTGKYGGQPRNRRRGRLDKAPLKSIVLIARKYGLDPKLLTEAFIEAWRSKMHQYGSLKISLREEDEDSVTFLVTNEDKVVSQFPIKLEILRNPELLEKHFQNTLI